jgi:hypothetical protein
MSTARHPDQLPRARSITRPPAVQMAGVSEALALGAALGLDPRQLSEVMSGSSARCWSLECYSPVPVGRRAAPRCRCMHVPCWHSFHRLCLLFITQAPPTAPTHPNNPPPLRHH